MSLSASTVWEVRTTGSDSNGGGFVAGASGTDFSQQDAAQVDKSDLIIDATSANLVRSNTRNGQAADVGNILQINAGAGFTTGFYQISAINGIWWQLDRAAGTLASTGGSGKMGGALASPGKAGAAHVGGNTIYVRNATYSITSASTNISGGCPSLAAGIATTNTTRLLGYGAARGDGVRPTLQASGISTFSLLTMAALTLVDGFIFDGANLTSGRAVNMISASVATAYRCLSKNCTSIAFQAGNAQCAAVLCEVTASSGSAFVNIATIGCVSHDCTTGGGYTNNVNAPQMYCVAANLSATAFAFGTGISPNVSNLLAYNCTTGFSCGTGAATSRLFNCLAVNCSGVGFSIGSAADIVLLWNCAGYNNASGDISANIPSSGLYNFVHLTASPFNNAGALDFSLNNAAGGGAALRAMGFPSSLPGTSTANYLDVGASQHRDSRGHRQIRTGGRL